MPAADRRRLLIIDATRRRHRLRTLRLSRLSHDPRENYGLLGGEALCQYLLREDAGRLVLARGPLPFLSGNKTTVGYVSPLTDLPHYSFVGGRAFAELLNLGLDAIVLERPPDDRARTAAPVLVVSGRAPDLTLAWQAPDALPTGQRAAFYHLLAHALDEQRAAGSVLTVGEAALHGMPIANLGVDGLYHAGRGGAGYVFARFLRALVLKGELLTLDDYLGQRAAAFRALRNGELRDRLERDCARFSRRDGGTVTKLYATGQGEDPTLPARNAQRLGYPLAELGSRRILKASRVGQTGCHWCQVNCRHWHWVPADYAPDGRDAFLDDFEPTYAIYAMLDLTPAGDRRRDKLTLLDEVDRRIMQPIEQLGADVIDVGVGIAALLEGLDRDLIPAADVPPVLRGRGLGDLDAAAATVEALRAGSDAPALRALSRGPQALTERYPGLPVFTSGPRTLGNPGHANALWTFLMPFSRFFSHYSGQIYKVGGELRPGMRDAEIDALFRQVIRNMLRRERFVILGNSLSMCGFTFIIFSEGGKGEALDDLLVRTLASQGIEISHEDLQWFAEAFWAQSIALKVEHGWRPPTADDYPERVFTTLSQTLDYPADELRALMARLIAEWTRQAGDLLHKYGYDNLLR